MDQYKNVFNRFEEKYLLEENQYLQILKKIQGKLLTDCYGKSTICSVYFDTPDYRIIRQSLEKPFYKEKLRLRSYGIPSEKDTVYVELKKKYDGIVYKRRVGMKLSEAVDYLYNDQKTTQSTQIIKEIDWALNYYPEIKPAMFVSYERTAMYGLENSNLRVTFDSNILWRNEQLLLDKGAWGNELLKPGQRLMEIKIPGAMPLWLSHILNDLKIYPTSFSKYGNAYLQSQKQDSNKKGMNYCA